MQWETSYCIGVDKIDMQHKRLMEFATSLEEAIQAGMGMEKMGEILKSLVEYTSYHFKDEEDLMLQMNFSDYRQHKDLHSSLIDDIRKILLDIRKGQPISANDLVAFLKKWIKDHIEKEDKKIGFELDSARTEMVDSSVKTDTLIDAPTHELEGTLAKLHSLASKSLITDEDLDSKKKDLLKKYADNFYPQSIVEVMEEFNAISNLAEKGLITNEDKMQIENEWSGMLDLSKIIADDDSFENAIERLADLLEKRIISKDIYNMFKEELLKKI